ncbi:MAG: hypothetical protein MUE81_21435 [Thermoflexibacter sp.]|nr:hypothetical protein [Thermoflexibacter sp.]
MKLLFYFILITFCALTSKPISAQDWQYLGKTQPKESPTLFAPYELSTNFNERDFAISPDGKEIYYSFITSERSAAIMVRKYENNKWQLAKTASFSDNSYNIEPAFSPDGKKLFFASNRSLAGGGTKDFDIWFVERKADGTWGEPQNLGEPVNTPADEYYPSLTKDGTIYYTAKYNAGIGGEDIWQSKWVNGQYTKPEVLPQSVNSAKDEFNAFIDPNGKYILFSSFGRADDMGRGDLYVSLKDANGEWTRAKHLQWLNSDRLDYCPYVSPDGKYLFFTSERFGQGNTSNNPFKVNSLLKRFISPENGRGDIYWVEMSTILK